MTDNIMYIILFMFVSQSLMYLTWYLVAVSLLKLQPVRRIKAKIIKRRKK